MPVDMEPEHSKWHKDDYRLVDTDFALLVLTARALMLILLLLELQVEQMKCN